MGVKTLEQKRARYAFDCIKEFKMLNSHKSLSKKISEKDYANQLRKLPSMIMQNGLLTTLVFLKSKSEVKFNDKNEKWTLNDEAIVLYQLVRYLDQLVEPKDKENKDKGKEKDESTISINLKNIARVDLKNIDISRIRTYLTDEYKYDNKQDKIEMVRESEYTKLINSLLDNSFSHYRVITSEALRISQWLKRIAEGEIEDEGQGSD